MKNVRRYQRQDKDHGTHTTLAGWPLDGYLDIGEAGNNPDVPQLKNRYRKYGLCTQWNTIQLLRTRTS